MKAIFPGSFDLIHKGHINIIKKANKLFDKLYIVITKNETKKQRYNLKTREIIIKKICQKINNNIIVLINNKKLTSKLAEELNITYIIRGLRNNKDLKFEMKMAFLNKKLNNKLETIFFIADQGLEKISSSKIYKHNKKIK